MARVLVLYTKAARSKELAKALKVKHEKLQGLSAHELFALMVVRLLPDGSKTRDQILIQMREWKA